MHKRELGSPYTDLWFLTIHRCTVWEGRPHATKLMRILAHLDNYRSPYHCCCLLGGIVLSSSILCGWTLPRKHKYHKITWIINLAWHNPAPAVIPPTVSLPLATKLLLISPFPIKNLTLHQIRYQNSNRYGIWVFSFVVLWCFSSYIKWQIFFIYFSLKDSDKVFTNKTRTASLESRTNTSFTQFCPFFISLRNLQHQNKLSWIILIYRNN